mmetsp:Transcript_19709/g.49018  ORF Transcript_19709/g.49018 Transcript_19709/m.49018 type:complete len:406 (-) Transcript_19709:29-1246(-)
MQVSFLFTALSTVRSSCKPHVHLGSSSVLYSRLQSPRNNPGFSFHQLYSSTSNNNIDGNNMSDFKRVKLDDSISDKVIGTHSGSFQADEAMGCFLLRQLPEYRLSRIVRSRDPKILETCDIVIDVGGVYDHDKLRYDHHQRGYDERFDEGKDGNGRCTKLSASGLVYRHYGKEVIKAHYPSLSSEHLDLVYVKLYNSLLEALDAIDTGVEMSAGELVYNDSTGLSSRVGRLNPRWNEVNENGEAPDPDERFLKASDLCGQDFVSVMTKIVESDLPAREVVEKAVLERLKTDASGEIICFPSGGLPWKGHLYELEKQHKLDKLVKFVLYTDQGGMWRVQAVTVEGTLFENRLGLPEEWRGVRDEDLEKLTNIKGCRFVHAAGFIGGNTFYEGALEMARVALQQSSK